MRLTLSLSIWRLLYEKPFDKSLTHRRACAGGRSDHVTYAIPVINKSARRESGSCLVSTLPVDERERGEVDHWQPGQDGQPYSLVVLLGQALPICAGQAAPSPNERRPRPR